MNFLRILFFLLIAGVVSWLGYFYFQNRRLPSAEEFIAAVTTIPSLFSEKASMSTSAIPGVNEQTQIAVSDALNEGKQRVDMVLGEAIEVASDSSKPAAQKALDYGRYLYCQQVVEEYELSQPNQ